MVIWQGFGFLSAIFFIVSLIVVGWVMRTVFGIDASELSKTAMIGTFLFAALLNFLMVQFWFDKQESRIVIDKKTEQEIELKKSHSLFFIPSKYWTYIFAGFGVLNIVFYVIGY